MTSISQTFPAGKHFMVDLDNAGGIPAVMSELDKLGLIHKDCLTVTGKTVGENLKALNARIEDPDVIHPIGQAPNRAASPFCAAASPGGAVVKQSAGPK